MFISDCYCQFNAFTVDYVYCRTTNTTHHNITVKLTPFEKFKHTLPVISFMGVQNIGSVCECCTD